MARVVVIGSLNIDSVLSVERMPTPGETLRATACTTGFGGKGANQAVAAAVHGASVLLVGCVGSDDDGARYIQRLSAFGVDTTSVRIADAAATGHATVMVDGLGENMIVVAPGANTSLSPADLVAVAAMTPNDVLLISAEVSTEVIVAAARAGAARGCRVILNLAPFMHLPDDVLRSADPLVVNQSEWEELKTAGQAPTSVLVTLGSEGSRWANLEVPAQRIDHAVDTTGAGDTYCGILAAELARGAAARDAMVAATVAAAAAIRRRGAQPELP